MDLTCPGCNIEYDTIEREPQNLSCGCDLCLMCVEERRGTNGCPEGHEVDWNRITVSRRVLKMVQAAQFSCPTHKGRPYDFWCPTCRVPLCGICAVSHKDVCLRASGGGVGSSNPSFYLIEMNNPSASEDLIRFAQEHTKAIDQSTADLEEAIPACLLKQPDEFAEFVQNKAAEAIQNFYNNLEKSISEMYERYNKEHAAALKEEEKRDAAVLQLAEVKGNIDTAIMELNVSVQNYREAEKEEKQAKEEELNEKDKNLRNANNANNISGISAVEGEEGAVNNNNNNTSSNAAQQAHAEKSKAKQNASTDMCAKAGQLASLIQKLIDEQTNGSLKGSVVCSNIRHLAEVDVMSLEALHPQWTTADPPARSCPLYRGTIRANSNVARSAGGYGIASGAYGESSTFYHQQNNQSSVGAGAGGYSSVSRLSGPRSSGTTYESRATSPNSQRRPRLMESLWREQLRNETSYSGTGASYSPPSSRLTQSQSSGPMVSPSGNTSGSVGRSSRY